MKHSSIFNLILVISIIFTGAFAITHQVQAQEAGPANTQAALGTAFTYQGRLTDSGTGNPITGTCDLVFSLYDAASGGSMTQGPIYVYGVTLNDGYFSAHIDFGALAFDGNARYLEIGVSCPSGGSFTTLTGRSELTAAPYAHSLRPGATVIGDSSGYLFNIFNDSTTKESGAIKGVTVSGYGVAGIVDWTQSGDGAGIYGQGAFYGHAAYFNNMTTNIPTVVITNSNYLAGGPALSIWGAANVIARTSNAAINAYNTTTTGAAHGLYGETASAAGYGVYGKSPNIGVLGFGDGESSVGVKGVGGNTGVHGETSAVGGHGVYGRNTHHSSGYGVYGRGFRGVEGYTSSSAGVGGFFRDMNTTASGTSVGLWVGSYYSDIIQGHELGSNGNSLNLRFRVTYDGNVQADGSYTSPAADFAEMLPALPGVEPGDVLVIGLDGQLARSTLAFSSTVVGVYSTQPGFIGGADMEGEDNDKIPLAIMGVVPVKASAENGAIQPGDLLVASSIPGHAMRAGENPPIGTVIGKALAALQNGTGVIQILVTLQ